MKQPIVLFNSKLEQVGTLQVDRLPKLLLHSGVTYKMHAGGTRKVNGTHHAIYVEVSK